MGAGRWRKQSIVAAAAFQPVRLLRATSLLQHPGAPPAVSEEMELCS